MRDPTVTARILWSSIFFSVFALFAVLRIAEHPITPAEPSLYPLLAALALSLAIASFLVPSLVHKKGALAASLETREMPNVVTPESQATTRRVFVDADKARAVAERLFMTSFILSLALSEAVGLFGFVLGFLGFSEERVLPFFVGSLVLLALRFPSPTAAEKMLEKSTQASF